MEPADPELLEGAFELLGDVVREYFAERRPCYSAGLKPAMQARAPEFFEGRLGFSSFREFLRVAEVQGIVQLQRAPAGPDVTVLPPGAAPPTQLAPPSPDATQGIRIRNDLWRAFFDWTPGFIRVYDTALGRAILLPEKPNPFQTSDQDRVRADLNREPERFVAIEPIEMDSQREWMEEFAHELPDQELQRIFRLALGSERPIAAFTRAVQADPRLGRLWQRRRAEKVRDEIQRWMEAHQLDVPVEEPSSAVDVDTSGDTRVASVEGRDVALLRERLHAAIDRMTYGDLLRLPIPVEYILRQS
jgi:hypothetical protein